MGKMIADKVKKNKTKIVGKKRSLSPGVGSISYQAPEVVINEK